MAAAYSGEGGYGGGSASVIHADSSHPDHIVIPDAQFLFTAHFHRAGPDLVLTGGDGHKLIIPGYFASEHPPALVAPNGASLSAHLVDLLAGPAAPNEYAQAGAAAPPDPIGRVEKVVGEATVIRNGVSVTLNVGDAIYKSDVVQTGANSSAGVAFPDGSALNLVANTRMALNEYSYDPNSTSNSALFSLVEGGLSFVAGKVAHSGDMKIGTPIATMGIRGTAGWLYEDQVATITAQAGNVTLHFAAVYDSVTNTESTYSLYAVDANGELMHDANGNLIELASVSSSQNGLVTTLSGNGVNALPSVNVAPPDPTQLMFFRDIAPIALDIAKIFIQQLGLPQQTNPQSNPSSPGSSTPPGILNGHPPPQPINLNIGPSQTPLTITVNVIGNQPTTNGLPNANTQQPAPQTQPTPSNPTWNGGSGSFNDPTNWSGPQPGPQNSPVVTAPNSHPPITQNETIQGLTVGPGDSVQVVGDPILTITGGGQVVVEANGSAVGEIEATGNGAAVVISGESVSNQGNIVADNSGGVAFVNDAITNPGIIDADAGGTISISKGSTVFNAGGTIEVSPTGPGAILTLADDTAVLGGTLTIGSGGELSIRSDEGATHGAQLLGVAVTDNGGGIDVGSVTSGATLTLLDDASITGGSLTVRAGSTLAIETDEGPGHGAVLDAVTADNSGIVSASGGAVGIFEAGSFTNESGGQVIATGTRSEISLSGDLHNNTGAKVVAEDGGTVDVTPTSGENDGTITADGGTVNLELRDSEHDNNSRGNVGTMQAIDRGTFTITGGEGQTFDNPGTLDAESGGKIAVEVATDNTGGEVSEGGQVTVSGAGSFIDFNLGITGGSATISDGGKLEYGWSSNVTTTFDGAGTLVLDNQNESGPNFNIPSYTIGGTTFHTASFTGTIDGFAVGDTLDLTGFGTQSTDHFQVQARYDADSKTTTLTIVDESRDETAAPIVLSGNYGNPNEWSAVSDGHGGIDVTEVPVASFNPTTYLNFDGSSSLQGPAATTQVGNGANDGVTLAGWVDWNGHSNAANKGQVLFYNGSTSDAGFGIFGLVKENGLDLQILTGGNQIVDTGVTLTADQWHNVALTHVDGNFTLYIDGVADFTVSGDYANPIPHPPYTDPDLMQIGGDAGGEGFAGAITDVSVWNTALSQSQIQALQGTHLSGSESGLAGYWPFTLTDGTAISGGALTIGSSGEVDIAFSDSTSPDAVFEGGLTVSNAGTLKIESDATLGLAGTVTLNGGGTVTMANGSAIENVATESPVVLDNVDNTIAGVGVIESGEESHWLHVHNESAGTIDANVNGETLNINTGNTIENAGTLEASGGGNLHIGDSLDNTGTLKALSNGELSVHGTVNNAGGSVVASGGFVDFELAITGGNATISNNGKLEYGWSSTAQTVFAGVGTLVLDHQVSTDPNAYTLAISGFAGGDKIDLTDLAYSANETVSWTQLTTGANASGTLKVTSDGQTADITLDGTYTTANFALTQDNGTGTEISGKSPQFWGEVQLETLQGVGVHLFPSAIEANPLNNVVALFYSSTTDFNPTSDPSGPYAITRSVLPLDPFFLPELAGNQIVQEPTELTLPARNHFILPNVLVGEDKVRTEGIAVYETQDGSKHVLDLVVVSGNSGGNDAPLNISQPPTPIESVGSDTIYNLDESFRQDNTTSDQDHTPYLSTYSVAWDDYASNGAYGIHFQIFHPPGTDGSVFPISSVVTPLDLSEVSATPDANGVTQLPAWEFRSGGGLYALAVATPGSNGDAIEFLGYQTDGTRNEPGNQGYDNTKLDSFTIAPDLAAYASGATSHMTQDVIPRLNDFPGGASQQLQFAQVSPANANDWAVGWNETVTGAGGAFLGDQVEFVVREPNVGLVPITMLDGTKSTYFTDQLTDAQNIRVETVGGGHDDSNDYALLAYGDGTATHLVAFKISDDGTSVTEIGSVIDATSVPYANIVSLGDGRFAIEYDNVVGANETSQYDLKIFDFRNTGTFVDDSQLRDGQDQYVAGTHYNDTFKGEPNADNFYDYVGADTALGSGPSDTFHGGGGSDGWNAAMFSDARSNYSITPRDGGGFIITNIGDSAHAGSLNVDGNVQALAFEPTHDPKPHDDGSIEATGGTLVLLTDFNNNATIDAGATLEDYASANSGIVTFGGSNGTFQVDQLHGFTGQVAGITAGDANQVLDLDGFGAQTNDGFSVSADHTGAVTVLTVTDTNNSTSEQITVQGDYAGDDNISWTATNDGHGGAKVFDPPPPDQFSFPTDSESITTGPNGETIYTIDSGMTVSGATNPVATIETNVVVAGPGNDTFIFQPGIGTQTVENFNPQQDTIELDHFAQAQSVQELQSLITTDTHGDAVINLGHNDSITLANTTTAQLQQAIQAGHVLFH